MFKNIFSFNGRIRRTEFGISYIAYMVLYLVILAVGESEPSAAYIYLGLIPLLWFVWAQGAKRCHDLGKSGWWQIIPFYIFWMIFQNGEYDENEYGDNPKNENRFDAEHYVSPFPSDPGILPANTPLEGSDNHTVD